MVVPPLIRASTVAIASRILRWMRSGGGANSKVLRPSQFSSIVCDTFSRVSDTWVSPAPNMAI